MPAPKTTHVEPASTRAVNIAAPRPVESPHAKSAACSNGASAETLRALGPHAVTDVTGFGLLGHLRELCAASGVHARVTSADLPLLPGVEALAREGLVPGGSRRNRAAADAYTHVAGGVDPVLALLAADAQTSGGLLAAVRPGDAGALGWVIGEIVAGPPGRITLV